MGNRGKLPRVIRGDSLDTLDPPPELTEPLALEFWNRHADYCDRAELLTRATVDSFVLLCDLYAKLRCHVGGEICKAYTDGMTKYNMFAKMFRLLPTEAPKQEVKSRFDNKSEFVMGAP